jgi:DNA-binding response OmpR family regulator
LRIKAILKRCSVVSNAVLSEVQQNFVLGDYTFDQSNMLLIHKNKTQSLTRKEVALLKLLCVNKDKLLTREFVLKSIWGDDDYFIGRSMDVFISKLRKHLKEDPRISITNIHGIGFKLEVKE